jgi:hypothetical protein
MTVRVLISCIVGVLVSLCTMALLPAQSDKVAQLYQAVKSETGGITITEGAASEIRSFLAAGARKSDVPEEKLREGARAFGRALAGNARFNESTGRKTIDVSVVRSAKQGICPLYPFC